MQAEIICIGDELLIGQVVNTNATWMGQRLQEEGIYVVRATIIPDDKQQIKGALHEAEVRSKLVLITGGLGPTKDDVTKMAVCEYFDTHLELNVQVLENIQQMFSDRNLPMLEQNAKQAELPASCTVIPNLRGTASGMWFEKQGVVFVFMPGVPYEMEYLMNHGVLQKIRNHFSTPIILHRTILTVGIGESLLAEKIEQWENSLGAMQVQLAYLPSPGAVKLRMSAYHVVDEEAMRGFINEKEQQLIALIQEFVYGFDEDTLAGVVGELLRMRGETLCLAESCTGGSIAQSITAIPGASDYFIGSWVTYAEEQKVELLSVSQETLRQFSVVSGEVAEAMAHGARNKMKTTWAISTTGIAGPGGGTDRNPVGTIWIGIAGPGGVKSTKLNLGKNRATNILIATQTALNLLRKEILS